MRVEITGVIGSGKSTLAKLLFDEGHEVVFEEFKLNPFWKAFYTNPHKYNFETEITFLLQHYHELKRKLEEVYKTVCDFSFIQDLAYAEMGLKEEQLEIFRSIYRYIKGELGEPSLLIHLYCSTSEAVRRIKLRGRAEEMLISEEFLLSLNKFITKEIHALSKTGINVQVLEFNTEELDIISNKFDRDFVLQKIVSFL